MKTVSMLLFAFVILNILVSCYVCQSEDSQQSNHSGEHESDETQNEGSQEPVAFTLKLTSAAPAGVVQFNSIVTEEGVSYNQTTGKVRILKDGLYSIHWNHVSLLRFAKSELMVDNSPVASLVSDVLPSGGLFTDDASTSGTFLLQNSSELSISTNETIQPESFFTGYLIREINNRAFYAATNDVVLPPFVPIDFQRYENVLLNTSSDFRVDEFVASVDGFYVFSVMSASFDGLFLSSIVSNGSAHLVITGESAVVSGPGSSTLTLRTLSSGAKTCLVRLNESDIVRVQVAQPFGSLTTGLRDSIPWIFTGFRYQDADVVNFTAVSVRNILQPVTELQVPINAFLNATVVLDNANEFSPTTGLFTATKEGLYIVSVTAQSSFPLRYEVLVSNNSVTSGLIEGYDGLVSTISQLRWFNGSGRVLVLFLGVNDTLQVNVTEANPSCGNNHVLIRELSIWELS